MTLVLGELSLDGRFIHITCAGDALDLKQVAGTLQTLTPNFGPLNDHPEIMAVPCSWAAVTQLAYAFPGGPRWTGDEGLTWAPGQRLSMWMIDEIIRRSCEGDFTGRLPALEPMAHQRAGGVAVGMNGHFIFTDDMGTGKTLTYLMGLAELDARNRYPWPALLVTPANVIDTVLEELPRFYPDWKAVAYRGSGRQKYLKSNANILVMSYETMRNDTGLATKPGPLLKLRPGSVTYDEAHVLCNFNSLQSREARTLAAHTRNVMAGSGTPITRNVGGFWPVLNCLFPESYPSRGRWKSHFCLVKGQQQYGSGDDDIVGIDPAREAEFRVSMQGVTRRVALTDVVDMPPKTYQVRYVDVPAAWRAAYDQMEQDMLAELPDQLTPLEANVAVVKMTRLRQLACSACDVETWREIETDQRKAKFGQEVQRTKVTLREPCWKGDALVGLLDEMHQAEGVISELGHRRGHTVGSRPVLAFAEYAQLTRLAGKMAEDRGYVVGYIDGSVKPRARPEIRHRFQANEFDLLCVTTGAGGVGLNLTAGADVAFLANPWGYVPRVQSERRSWRRGQTRPVTIYDFVAKNTVESRVRARLKDKAVNLADLLQDPRIAREFLGGS